MENNYYEIDDLIDEMEKGQITPDVHSRCSTPLFTFIKQHEAFENYFFEEDDFNRHESDSDSLLCSSNEHKMRRR